MPPLPATVLLSVFLCLLILLLEINISFLLNSFTSDNNKKNFNMSRVNLGRMFLHIKINDSLQQCQCKTCRESLSCSRSYLPPLYPSIQNLLIITLISVLNNMPPAHFLVFSPPPFHPFVLASFSSYLHHVSHLTVSHSLAYILTCHYNCSHLSFLTSPCPASICPTSSHTELPSVCTGFCFVAVSKEKKET